MGSYTFFDYIIALINGVPQYIYGILLGILFGGGILFFASKGKRKGSIYCWRLLLCEYVFVLLSSTVLFRTALDVRQYDYHPFWSYSAIMNGDEQLLPENIMNVVVFVPVGILLGCGFRSMRWWKVLMAGVIVSASIEGLQFFLRRGFSEVDDVMHNTVGCLIGFGLFSLARYGYEKVSERRMGVL